jgi:hypothetical protein
MGFVTVVIQLALSLIFSINQLGPREEFNDETKLMHTSIAKTFSSTSFSGDLQSYTLYQMGRTKTQYRTT